MNGCNKNTGEDDEGGARKETTGRDEHVSAFCEPHGSRKQGHHLCIDVTAGGCLAALPTLCLSLLK